MLIGAIIRYKKLSRVGAGLVLTIAIFWEC